MRKSRLSLEKQMVRFIDSGFKKRYFTDELYEMLYIHSDQFIAHFNKEGFYRVRFEMEADNTINSLENVTKKELKELCTMLATAMKMELFPDEVKVTNWSVVQK